MASSKAETIAKNKWVMKVSFRLKFLNGLFTTDVGLSHANHIGWENLRNTTDFGANHLQTGMFYLLG